MSFTLSGLLTFKPFEGLKTNPLKPSVYLKGLHSLTQCKNVGSREHYTQQKIKQKS